MQGAKTLAAMFLRLFLPLLINRFFILWVQQASLGLEKPWKQVSVGLANDAFLAAFALGLLLIAEAARQKLRKPWRVGIRLPLFGLVGALYTLTGLNSVYVFVYQQNLSWHEFSYLRDLAVLWDSAWHELQNHKVAAAAGLAAALACVCMLRQAYRLSKGATVGGRLLVALLLLTAGLRSLSLSFRTVLHEPTETHIVPYLAWRYRLDLEHKLAKPEAGFARLAAYQEQKLKAPAAVQALPRHNLVVVLLESFGMGQIRRKPTIAPFLLGLQADAHAQPLPQHFTSVYRTIGAQYALLCSRYDPLPFFVIRDYPQKHGPCLPEYLGAHGYTTSWVSGSPPGFDYNAQWLAKHGVKTQFTAADFAADGYTFSYGVHDERVFERLPAILAAQAEPFFSYVLTVSNHHPYNLPASFYRERPDAASLTPEDQGLAYTDLQIKKFMSAARSQAWFDHTIFVFVGDHPHWSYAVKTPEAERGYAYYREQYHTLAFLWSPTLTPAAVGHDTSHIDIAPSLLDLLGLPASPDFLGESLYRPQQRQAIASQDNVRSSYYQIHNPQEIIRGHHSSGSCQRYTPGTSGAEPCQPNDREQLRRFREEFLDTTQWQVTL